MIKTHGRASEGAGDDPLLDLGDHYSHVRLVITH